jgi:hypothetical protein
VVNAEAPDRSWIDVLIAWTERLPGPTVLYYLIPGLAISGVQYWMARRDPALLVGADLPFVATYGLWPFMFLYVHGMLARTASSSFREFVTALELPAAEADRLEYALTLLPGIPTLLITLVGAGAGVWTSRALSRFFPPFVEAAPTLLPIGVATAALFCALIYRVVRQLRQTVALYRRCDRIDLARLAPLSALSRFTMVTAVTMVAITYLAMAVAPGVLGSTVYWAMLVLVTTLALAMIVWPVLEIQARVSWLRTERLADIDRRIETVWPRVRDVIDEERHSEVAPYAVTLELLRAERARVEKIGTWVWSPGSLLGVLVFTFVPPVLKFLWALFAA